MRDSFANKQPLIRGRPNGSVVESPCSPALLALVRGLLAASAVCNTYRDFRSYSLASPSRGGILAHRRIPDESGEGGEQGPVACRRL